MTTATKSHGKANRPATKKKGAAPTSKPHKGTGANVAQKKGGKPGKVAPTKRSEEEIVRLVGNLIRRYGDQVKRTAQWPDTLAEMGLKPAQITDEIYFKAQESIESAQAQARQTQANNAPPVGNKKMSAINAAALVLAEEKRPMSADELVEVMGKRRYWSSPSGLTPEATLAAAIYVEIKNKGDESRFTKVERGMFALTS